MSRAIPRAALLACWLTAVAGAAVGAAAEASARDVRVAVYENGPKIGLDGHGNPCGIFVDVIKEIAEREGWTLLFVYGTWAEGLERLEQGGVDLMPDVAFTAERDRQYGFCREPVLYSWNQVYVARGSSVNTLLDLDGKRIAVLDGSIQQRQFESMVDGFGLKPQLERYPDFPAAFRAVAEGKADAVVTNRYYGGAHAGDFGLMDTAVIFSPHQLHFATALKRNADLREAVDRHVADLKKDPGSAYYKSLRRWTTDEVPPLIPPWVAWSALGAGLLLLMALGWVATLRSSARRQQLLMAQLAVAKEAAEAADHAKSAFLATMSHELRTPLNSIIGFTGIMKQGLAGPLNEEQSKQMGMVSNSAEHLLSLINDVLDLSKIQAGQVELTKQPFNVREMIDLTVDGLQPQAYRKKLTLEAELAPELGDIMGDQRRVRQVLMNLLSNAIKFTESGSVKVKAAPSDEGRRVRVTVTDSGQGMKPDELGKLFKPFSQLQSGINRRHEGTGLGLSISKKLIELHGGTVWVESEWGKGSTFGFDLPVGEVPPPDPIEDAEAGQSATAGAAR